MFKLERNEANILSIYDWNLFPLATYLKRWDVNIEYIVAVTKQ